MLRRPSSPPRVRGAAASQVTGNLYECVEYVGSLLEKLEVPKQQLNPPCCVLFWCTCKYTPGRSFLRSCIGRMHFVVWAALVVIIGRVLLHALDMHLFLGSYLNFWSLLMVFVSLSCKLPLDALLEPLVLPSASGRQTESLRKLQFNLFFTLIGGVHNMVTGITLSIGCPWFLLHQNIVLGPPAQTGELTVP